ncbi:MAG: signal peptidase I [Mollicutes bacterium]|nr:signal peptidase I [Mollicutes bacterium]
MKRIKEIEGQKKANKDILLDNLPYIIIILIIIIIRAFIATPIRVNGDSMDPTLQDGETMILNKLGMKTAGIKRWDIIVIKTDDSYLIKRVIGLPGESIKYENGKLYIAGKEIKDNYSLTKTEDFEETIVGKNEYFVMGDNRFISKDSRKIGTIDKSEILGKTNIIVFPFNRFGLVK